MSTYSKYNMKGTLLLNSFNSLNLTRERLNERSAAPAARVSSKTAKLSPRLRSRSCENLNFAFGKKNVSPIRKQFSTRARSLRVFRCSLAVLCTCGLAICSMVNHFLFPRKHKRRSTNRKGKGKSNHRAITFGRKKREGGDELLSYEEATSRFD